MNMSCPREEDTYTIPYACSNCGKQFDKRMKQGRIAPSRTTCDVCGCEDTASKRAEWKR